MSKLVYILGGLFVVTLILHISLRMSMAEQKQELERLQGDLISAQAPDLASAMGRLQVYLDKLWHAGVASNADLAEFYRHEIEEVMEDLIEAKIEDDGHDISMRIKQMALPAVEAMALKDGFTQAGFEQDFMNLMNACNSCHQITDHGFIRLQVSEVPIYNNQLFLVD